MASEGTVVDLAFALRGSTIPADHGYALYSAISQHLPTFHADREIGIHPIRGQLIGARRLALGRPSHLVLRLPVTRIPEAIRLAGRRLEVGDAACLIGIPTVQALRPAAALLSRLVVIRGFTEEDVFLDAVRRQMANLEIDGQASLVPYHSPQPLEGRPASADGRFVRRTLRIHDKEVVGFSLCVDQLTAEESLRLQEAGLGGRRRFGCGIFLPSRW